MLAFFIIFLIIPFTLARFHVILCMDYSILSLFVSDSSSSPKLLKSKIDDFMFTILMISYQVLNINCLKICILFALRTKYMYVHFYMQKHIVKLVFSYFVTDILYFKNWNFWRAESILHKRVRVVCPCRHITGLPED